MQLPVHADNGCEMMIAVNMSMKMLLLLVLMTAKYIMTVRDYHLGILLEVRHWNPLPGWFSLCGFVQGRCGRIAQNLGFNESL